VRPVISDPAKIRRVLIVKLSSLGDVIHALPLAESLRAGLGPSAEIVWAVRDKFADLLTGNPHLTRVSILKGRDIGSTLELVRTLKTENRTGFDVAVDAQGLLLSGVITRLSGAPVRIGMDRNREGNALFLTHPVVPGKQREHIVRKLLRYCDALGLPALAPRPQRYLADGQRAAAQALLAESGEGPRIGLIVGASTADKMWPAENWAALAGILEAKGLCVVLLGGPGERATADRIRALAKGISLVDLTGRTPIPVLASVMAECDVVVGGDSGPTHLAVGIGVPVVGLYGVTDPAMTGPEWGAAPAVTLDYAVTDAPPESRRPRHSTLTGALARIPAPAVGDAVERLLRNETAPKSST